MKIFPFLIILIISTSFKILEPQNEVHILHFESPSEVLKDGVLVERYSTGSMDLYKLN